MKASASPVPSRNIETLQQIATDVVAYARKQGASASVTEVSEGYGQTVSVRRGEVETIEYNRDKGISVSVYLGQRRGHASTSDFSRQALHDTVDAAVSIARHTAEDDCAGLPDADQLATTFPQLGLYHPWSLDVEQAITLARDCEQAAFASDKRVVNSEGASVSIGEGSFVLANSLGFTGGYPTSRHSVSCSVIAGKGKAMERDYWYSQGRDAAAILKVEEVGRIAAERAVRRLGARKLATRQCPVLFEAPVAAGLLGHFVQAASGGSLYRKSSFLLDQLDQPVFAGHISIEDDPFIPGALGSSPFDDEGVRVQKRNVVEDGVLRGYFLGCYSARKLGMLTTGNAGGSHNLSLRSTRTRSFDALLQEMGEGLLVTELLGHGVNNVTGDYSRGAAGFLVKDGEISHPVHEITIAGNLRDMYRDIVAVGEDVLVQGARRCGSVLVGKMTVAGS